MNAQGTLWMLLVAELSAAIYGYANDSHALWVMTLPIFLPVTLVLFLATACGLDKQGRLKRDTIFFKIIRFYRPEVESEKQLRICPTFWVMSSLTAVMVAFAWVAGHGVWQIASNFEEFKKVLLASACLAFAIGYLIAMAFSAITVANRTSGSLLSFSCWTSTFALFFLWPMVALERGFGPHQNPVFMHYFNYSLVNALFYALAWFGITALIALMVHLAKMTCQTVTESALPGYVVSFVKSRCPVVEIAPEDNE